MISNIIDPIITTPHPSYQEYSPRDITVEYLQDYYKAGRGFFIWGRGLTAFVPRHNQALGIRMPPEKGTQLFKNGLNPYPKTLPFLHTSLSPSHVEVEREEWQKLLHPLLSYMGGCQNYGPLLGTLNTRGRIIIIGIQKGTIILTTTHIGCKYPNTGVLRPVYHVV